ncbi:hemocyanin B chain isoform X2 [Folsomia candida]|uniref:hemocyanin B chain isoform X2 n=1 Tax=Folsomia candida TaxID=158441 RepID=UPI001604F32C|nr:hemocyanin B chain isoform X2 [Folsomia candida]
MTKFNAKFAIIKKTAIMKRSFCYFFTFISSLIFQAASQQSQQTLSGDAATWKSRQTQISNLFHFICPRNKDQINAVMSDFNPLNYLNLYSNPTTVKEYIEQLHADQLYKRWDTFIKRWRHLDEMTTIFEILYFIDVSQPVGWDLFYNTTSYLSVRVNVGQFVWATGTLFSTKFFGLLSPPVFYDTLPQLYTRKEVIRSMNRLPEPPPPPAGHVDVYDEPAYWIQDASLESFHFWWHTDLPNVMDNKKYGFVLDRKGELFFYTHHQLMGRYFAERRSNNLGDIEPISLSDDFLLRKGFEPVRLNYDLGEYPTRGPNMSLKPQEGFQILRDSETRLLEAIQNGYAINGNREAVPLHNNPESFASDISGNDMFGAIVESSTSSINIDYYGSIHGDLHGNIADIIDPRYPQEFPMPGVQDHQEVNLPDPTFYQIHLYIDNLHRRHKYASPQIRSEKELVVSGVQLRSLKLQRKGTLGWNIWPWTPKVQVLTTYFEDVTRDVSNAVVDCNRLSQGHMGVENFIARIFMAPYLGADGKPSSEDDLHWSMFEMDKFPFVLKPGLNRLTRPSGRSLVCVGHEDQKLRRACGWPRHLLLPKGTADGLAMKLFVLVSPAQAGQNGGAVYTVDNEMNFPALSLCGHPWEKYPDDKPMGYPFDKKIHFDPPFAAGLIGLTNYGFYDVLIKHVTVNY